MYSKRGRVILIAVLTLVTTSITLYFFSFATVHAAGSVVSWFDNTPCSTVFPNFIDRGMDGWSSSGSSERCWAYWEGYTGYRDLEYTGDFRGFGFRVNERDLITASNGNGDSIVVF